MDATLATFTAARAEDTLAEDGPMLAEVYAVVAAYAAERGIDLDVSCDTEIFTSADVAAMRARLAH